MIEPGQTAPDFELPDQDGNPVRLGDCAAARRPLLLSEGRHARAARPRRAASATTARLRRRRRHGPRRLPRSREGDQEVPRRPVADFTLLADEDHAVCEPYGVWVEKKNYGRTYWGAQRATFLIDEEGVVRHVIPKASPKTHDDEVLAALGDLKTAA